MVINQRPLRVLECVVVLSLSSVADSNLRYRVDCVNTLIDAPCVCFDKWQVFRVTEHVEVPPFLVLDVDLEIGMALQCETPAPLIFQLTTPETPTLPVEEQRQTPVCHEQRTILPKSPAVDKGSLIQIIRI